MLRWPSSYRYLTRLNVPPTQAERSRVETHLGGLRLLLAALALVAFSIDLPEPPQYAHLVYVLMSVWVVHSLLVFAWVSARPITPAFLRGLHVADIIWPTLITAFSHGPSSPFVPIYSFALLSAGFRWGFSEAVLTAVAGCFVLWIEVFLLRGTPLGRFEGNRLLVRCAYLFALGYLIGTLGENEKERRAESAVVSRLLGAARAERSMSAVIKTVFAEFIHLFNASHVFLVSHELVTDRVYLWQMTAPEVETRPYPREIHSSERLAYLLPDHPSAFFCERLSNGELKTLTLDSNRNSSPEIKRFPALSIVPTETKSLLSVTTPLGNEWRIRLLLLNARMGKNALQELTFARFLFEQAATAIYGVYLVHRLRARAGTIERARVARELHDGAIQSIIASEMRADILRRRALTDYPPIAPEIESLQDLLRNQVFELRELMQQLKPVVVEPNQLLDHLAEQVDRFRRDSGIAARFISSDDEIQLSAHSCREILLIVQEALVNIRKHAHAENVLVTFGHDDGYLRLCISDNGVGFGFEGTLGGTELMKSAKGPAVIKERVANLGGELFIESKMSCGSQLLIKLPQKGYFSHGQQ
jgi:signal transduction histidine kinase